MKIASRFGGGCSRRGGTTSARPGRLLMNDDRKSFRRWLQSQGRYTELEARKLARADAGELRSVDRMRRWVVVVPPAMFVYCLVVRGGVLDGWQGLYYAFQRTVAELMLAVNLGRGFVR